MTLLNLKGAIDMTNAQIFDGISSSIEGNFVRVHVIASGCELEASVAPRTAEVENASARLYAMAMKEFNVSRKVALGSCKIGFLQFFNFGNRWTFCCHALFVFEVVKYTIEVF